MAISKSMIGQHKRMAMGEKDVGFKKGGSVKKDNDADDSKKKGGKVAGKKKGGSCGYAEGGSVAETYNGGTGINRDDMTGKRIKEKDGEISEYKKGGSTAKGKKK